MPAPTTYEIGAALGSIATLTSLGAIAPESTFIEYAESIRTAGGVPLAVGLPRAEWHYGYLYKAQYDVFRNLCAGAGASVCIATLNNDMEYVRYNCAMEMPPQYVLKLTEGRQIYQDVTIKFYGLVEAE